MINKLTRLYHTLKYLKPTQLYGQVFYKFKKPKRKRISNIPLPRQIKYPWTQPISKRNPFIDDQQLQFLNQTHQLDLNPELSNSSIDKLWLYHLHYCEMLLADVPASLHRKMISEWIDANRSVMGCGWEPYPTSLRIVNWIKWSLAGNEFDAEMKTSLVQQINCLNQQIEFHIQGNHLLANAKALLFAGMFFTGKLAERWLHTGYKLFSHQMIEQVLIDGGHFELSPMYHSIILEDLLDVINLLQTYDYPVPVRWIVACEKMFNWLKQLCHPDGKIAFFNDAAFGMAPTQSDLLGYIQRLNISIQNRVQLPLTLLKQSGYCRIDKGNLSLIVDVGEVGASYQPGHAHADTLSFELSIGEQRVFINSGTSTYNVGAERERQRSTAAHNTVEINRENSSQVWKSFRVGKRAHIINLETQVEPILTIKATHDGYLHPYGILHTRIFNCDAQELEIIDLIEFQNKRKISSAITHVELFYHCHPALTLQQKDEQHIMMFDDNEVAIGCLTFNYPCRIAESTFHPEFNLVIANKKIIVEADVSLPATLKTIFNWEV